MSAQAVDPSYVLRRQTEAAKSLLANLRANGEDDAELEADAIEGETGLLEAIAAALDANDEDEVLVVGLKAKEEQFASRRAAIEARIERRKASVERAMMETDQTTLRLPSATLTLAKRQPGLVVGNEAEIPARFWIEQPRPAPKLDKAALKEALKSNETIPGASLDNGSVSLTVRKK